MWPSVSAPASPQSAASGISPMPRLSKTMSATRSKAGRVSVGCVDIGRPRGRNWIENRSLLAVYLNTGDGAPPRLGTGGDVAFARAHLRVFDAAHLYAYGAEAAVAGLVGGVV